MFTWLKKIFVPAETTEPLVLDKPVVMKKAELTKMSKKELEQLGRDHGIELDRRLTKSKLINKIKKHIK